MAYLMTSEVSAPAGGLFDLDDHLRELLSEAPPPHLISPCTLQYFLNLIKNPNGWALLSI